LITQAGGPKKNVLICGGAGFIGFHLGSKLVTEGHDVIALDNFNSYYSPALKRARAEKLKTYGVSMKEADLCDEQIIEQLLQTNNFTHIVNLAAQAGVRYSLKDPQSYVKANVQCWVTLLEALKTRSHIKVVYASSSSVYGDNSVVPFSVKNSAPHPQSMYAASKMAAEHTAAVYNHLYNLKLVGLRFFTVYGPWGRPDMAIFSFSEDIKAGKAITVYEGGLERDFTFVEDIVDGIVGAMNYENEPGHSIFNLGNSKPVSVENVVKLLESKSNLQAKINKVPKPATEIQITYADISESTKLLGYKAKTSIEQGVSKWMDWFNGPDYKMEYGRNHQTSLSNELQTITVPNMDNHNTPEFEMGADIE
jgi:UDP-glucuronate 4-epimerase